MMDNASNENPLRRQIHTAIVIIFITIIVIAGLFTRETPTLPTSTVSSIPHVSVVIAKADTTALTIDAQGLVEPKKQLNLVAQVPGTITYINPIFASGNRFKQGDILLKVDTQYLNMEVQKANAAYQQARLREAEIHAEHGEHTQSPQQSAAASASLAALATLEFAKQQLSAATLRAPFSGQVINRVVNEQDQMITGRPIGQIFSTDALQVRIALNQQQLTLLGKINPTITTFTAASNNDEWQGFITRSENMIGANRMITVIGEIPLNNMSSMPLLGSLLNIQIRSQAFDNIITIPNHCTHHNTRVWIVNDNQLVENTIELIYQNAQYSYVSKGINAGDNIACSPTNAYTGMKVSTQALKATSP